MSEVAAQAVPRRYSVVLGPLPPPITGAAKNTKNIVDALRMNAVEVAVVSTAVSLKRESAGLAYHVRRVGRVLGVIVGLIAAPDRGPLYVVPDAGLGAWYTYLYLLLAHWRFPKVIFHHRSFAYINRPARPMQLMVNLTQRKALHVCLSDGMAARFVQNYGAVRTLVVTNACFVANEVLAATETVSHTADPHGPIVLGHLSNLRRDKGFFDVADVFERLLDVGKDVELLLAGPITEKEVEPRLAALKARHGARVRHLGLVSGDAKTQFYRDIDLFLFPTRHPQEAQPNVLFEALAGGVPVIATPRATIPEMVTAENGLCSPTEQEFVDFAVAAIHAMSFDAEDVVRRSDSILAWMREEVLHSQRQYRDLMAEFGLARESVKAPWL